MRTRAVRVGGIDIAVVVAILLGTGAAALVALPPSSGRSSPSTAPMVPTLSIDPPNWWMVDGNSTAFEGTWTGVPAGCAGSPLWYRWSLVGGFVEGSLDATEGAWANFTANADRTGTATVGLRSAFLLVCGANRNVTVEAATTNVTIVAPPVIENLSLAPDPIAAGGVTNLTVDVVNGAPPYQLRVDWGDGNVTTLSDVAPGPVTLAHEFPAGSYSPSVLVTDSAGFVVNATVGEPVYASAGLAVAVRASSTHAEVGIPVEFSGVLEDPPSSYGFLTECEDALAPIRGPAPASFADKNFSCTFADPGVTSVDFEVVPVGDDLPPLTAVLSEPVAAPLTVGVPPVTGVGEVGRPTVVRATIGGGVPPFHVTWTIVGNSTPSSTVAVTDGPVELPVWPSEPGAYAVTVRVADALGAVEANGTSVLTVDGPLGASATGNRSLTEGGARIAIEGSVTGGVPPFSWWVVPTLGSPGALPGNGSLGSAGTFGWNGTSVAEGNGSVEVVVVDSVGADWTQTLAFELVPPLGAAAVLRASPSGSNVSLTLNLSVRGGLPPFNVTLGSSERETWNRTASSDGTYSWTFPTNDSGSVEFELAVVDRLGVEWTSNETLELVPISPPAGTTPPPTLPNATAPAPPPASAAAKGAGDAWVIGAGVLAVLTGLAVALLVRRRRVRPASPTRPGPDPVAIVRRIVEPAEGAERSTVELLAEEAGVASAVVRETIDRLVADGTLRSEVGTDGEEVLAWSEPS